MLNAKEIKSMIPKGGSLVMTFSVVSDGKMAVVAQPQYPAGEKLNNESLSKASEEVRNLLKRPVVVTGTEDELDAGFMGFMEQVTEKKSMFQESLASLDDETKVVIAKAKEDAAKKVEEAKRKAKQDAKTKPPVKVEPAVPSAGDMAPGSGTEAPATGESRKTETSEGGGDNLSLL